MGGGIVSSVPLAFCFSLRHRRTPAQRGPLLLLFASFTRSTPSPYVITPLSTLKFFLARIIISPPSRSARNVATTALSLLAKVQYVPQKGQGVEVHLLPLLLLI